MINIIETKKYTRGEDSYIIDLFEENGDNFIEIKKDNGRYTLPTNLGVGLYSIKDAEAFLDEHLAQFDD